MIRLVACWGEHRDRDDVTKNASTVSSTSGDNDGNGGGGGGGGGVWHQEEGGKIK